MKKSKKVIFASLILALTGCATSEVNQAEIGKVRKVAVVAYTATLPASQTLSLDVGSGKTTGAAGGSLIAQNSSATDEILKNLNLTFARNKGWSVISVDTMKKHPAYIQAYKATMEGWQNKMPPGAGQKNYLVDGVMDKDGVRLLGPEGKNQLIKALQVDAVIVANVYTRLEGFTVMGIGKRKPQTTVTLYVYSKNQDGPIWFESFKGDESEESVGMTGFIDEDKLQSLSLASAKSAFTKIK